MQTERDLALDKAKVNLICRPDSVFISTILFSLKFDWSTKYPTAATNGTMLFVNPDYFMELTPGQRIFLLAHEAYHVAFQHMVRVGERNFKVWNMATDYVINLMLTDSGFEFINGGLLSQGYRDMSSYEVYDLLDDQDPDDLPDCPDDMVEVEGTPDQIAQAEQAISDLVSQAQMQAQMSNQGGTVPGEINVFLDKLRNPKLPWYKILSNLLNGQAKDDYSFRQPNRRFLPNHYLPGMYSESLGDIAVAVDISGSITQKQFDSFITEINSIHQSAKPDKTHVVSFDTRISGEYTIEQQNDIMGLKFEGGGGTDIEPLYEWAKENQPKALIIFTDGYFHLAEDKIPAGIPLYWIIHTNTEFTCSKGKIITFSDED